MRKVIAISMPEEMHQELCRSISKTRYGSVSEYIRELVRRDQTQRSADADPIAPGPEVDGPTEPWNSSRVYEFGGLRFECTPAADLVAEFARRDKTSS